MIRYITMSEFVDFNFDKVTTYMLYCMCGAHQKELSEPWLKRCNKCLMPFYTPEEQALFEVLGDWQP